MSLTSLIFYYLIFAVLGWILDSTFSSLSKGKFINSGYFRELPLCPIYGFGGVLLLLLTQILYPYHWILTIMLGSLVLILTEYFGGVFCVAVLKERLWNYSLHKWHLHGHIDFFHCLCWIAATVAFYFLIYPKFILMNNFIQTSFPIPWFLDFTLAIVFVLGAIIYTINNQKKRLKRLKK